MWRRVLEDPFEGRLRAKNADYTTVDKKAKEAQNIQAEVNASSSLSAKERRVYEGLHHNAKKTQLSDAEGC